MTDSDKFHQLQKPVPAPVNQRDSQQQDDDDEE